MDDVKPQKEAEIWDVQTRPEIAKYEVICSYSPKGKLTVACPNHMGWMNWDSYQKPADPPRAGQGADPT